jgi:hypothetical protein
VKTVITIWALRVTTINVYETKLTNHINLFQNREFRSKFHLQNEFLLLLHLTQSKTLQVKSWVRWLYLTRVLGDLWAFNFLHWWSSMLDYHPTINFLPTLSHSPSSNWIHLPSVIASFSDHSFSNSHSTVTTFLWSWTNMQEFYRFRGWSCKNSNCCSA